MSTEIEARSFLDGAAIVPRPQSSPEWQSEVLDYAEAKIKDKGGRPSTYDFEIALKICEKIGDGGKLRDICKAEDMPSTATAYRWLATIAEFQAAYHCALLARSDLRADEMIEIADDSSDDFELDEGAGGMPTVRPNREAVARSALRIETRKWIMSKELPRKYGELKAIEAPAPPTSASTSPQDAKLVNPTPQAESPLLQSLEAWKAAHAPR